MKRNWLFVVAVCLILSGCGNLEKGITNIDQGDVTTGGNITTGRIDQGVYQAVMTEGKYQTSAARKLNAEKLNNGFNQTNFENGLLRLCYDTFSVDDHYFQEGQYIAADIIKNWLKRGTDDQDSQGLNPASEDEPIIFQQLMEHNFLKEDGKTLGGISLGFAFNSVYYGSEETMTISRDTLMANALKTVNTVLTYVRQIDGLSSVPIVIGLFEQSAKNDTAGGNYIYQAVSTDGGTTIDQFEPVNEAHLILPVASGTANAATDDGLNSKFITFRDAIISFFPDLAGVSGKVYYVNDQVQKLVITIDSNYYSKTEVTSFTQYAGKQVETVFSDVPGVIEVQIGSISGQQAFLSRDADGETISSFVFN
ncbi:hypothetical protein A5886_001362 [Enterococcus sp. 8G7_MSG3316]|uniref:CamS family sex pheromone protein n=1 Tax=Candidatus Enterococcus testudinis TaxID=1834191 RepID=A0A242A5H4_9ENTE|nr:CamS family sex pheromone protein [Enterococcus sp. 8G7_MSG3316]OTN76285.1 hypothetical protein A5886_001362 [Enterococcus sp. 8G7_MSG3316]